MGMLLHKFQMRTDCAALLRNVGKCLESRHQRLDIGKITHVQIAVSIGAYVAR